MSTLQVVSPSRLVFILCDEEEDDGGVKDEEPLSTFQDGSFIKILKYLHKINKSLSLKKHPTGT